MVEADAEAFLDASVLVADRREFESPSALGAEVQDLLETLSNLPLVAVFDRAPVLESERRVEGVLKSMPRDLLDAADDAVVDNDERARGWPAEKPDRLALAAAEEDHVVLLRMLSGRWFVSTSLGVRRLSFEFDEGVELDMSDIAVVVEGGAPLGALAPDDGMSFEIPDAPDGLDLRLYFGPDSCSVHFGPTVD